MPSGIAIDSTQQLQGILTDAYQTALMLMSNNQRMLDENPEDEILYDKYDHLQRVTKELEKMSQELEKLIPSTKTHERVRCNYHGVRSLKETRVTKKAEYDSLPEEALPERQDLSNHSPWFHSSKGFGWGYRGPEPAQLAMAILADATRDDDYATRWHQVFKQEVIAGIRKDHWTILGENIEGWMKDHP